MKLTEFLTSDQKESGDLNHYESFIKNTINEHNLKNNKHKNKLDKALITIKSVDFTGENLKENMEIEMVFKSDVDEFKLFFKNTPKFTYNTYKINAALGYAAFPERN